MEQFVIVKSEENEENFTASYNKSQVINKYRTPPIEVNIYHYPKESGFSIDSPSGPDAVKTYYVLRGMCKNLETNKVLLPGDMLIVREIDELLNLYMIEATDILVHAVNFNAYNNIEKSAEAVSNVLSRIQKKDSYTEEHCNRVFLLVYKMVLKLGYTGNRLYNIARAARYHDVGKIYIDDSILTKPGKLTEEEYEIMKSHVIRGKEMLVDYFSDQIFILMSQHHERIDGTGYPYGLVGEEITEEGRVLAICDSFDAMTTDRIYHKGKSVQAAIKELKELAGIKYDSILVDIFVEMVNESGFEKPVV